MGTTIRKRVVLRIVEICGVSLAWLTGCVGKLKQCNQQYTQQDKGGQGSFIKEWVAGVTP